MARWLQKVLGSFPAISPRHMNLPVQREPVRPLLDVRMAGPVRRAGLPNASIVYGIGASVLIVLALYLIVSGAWFTGLLVFLPAASFVGFALHFLRGRG